MGYFYLVEYENAMKRTHILDMRKTPHQHGMIGIHIDAAYLAQSNLTIVLQYAEQLSVGFVNIFHCVENISPVKIKNNTQQYNQHRLFCV